jgi:hypothetical protein
MLDLPINRSALRLDLLIAKFNNYPWQNKRVTRKNPPGQQPNTAQLLRNSHMKSSMAYDNELIIITEPMVTQTKLTGGQNCQVASLPEV